MILLALLSAIAGSPPPAIPPEVLGLWRSAQCESAGAAAPISMRRTFALSEARWQVEVTLFDGGSCADPFALLEVEGAWTATGTSATVPEALEITAFYDRKRATALSSAGAERLVAAQCGKSPWRPGLTQDVADTGCLALTRVEPGCLQEYDLLAIDGGRLRFGSRAGSMCTSAGRPHELSPFALERVPALSAASSTASLRSEARADIRLPAFTQMADLTHVLDERFPYIPVPGVTFPFQREPIATLERDGVAAGSWRIHEHLGTQIDAPSHFAAGARALHELRPDELIRPLVILDVRERAKGDPDLMVTADDVRRWEAEHGRVPMGAVVVLHTGWGLKIGDAAAYLGVDAGEVKHFPGWSPDAARYLAELGVWGLGVDTVSYDPGADGTYQTHRTASAAGLWALEAIANLDLPPVTGAWLIIGAPRVRDATGGPARLIAVW